MPVGCPGDIHDPGERTPVTVQRIDDDTHFVDIRHLGRPGAIGTGVLEHAAGIALVDPGPTSCLEELRCRLEELGHALVDVDAILLTHIHLDHAMASGAIAREAPRARVYVHPRGARHMIDPSRLLASAERIYGSEMERLWGEFVPVPASSVVEVDEGHAVELGGRRLDVAYVPGHAKHHVAYHEEAAGTAWIGDVGGIRLPGGLPVPVTPPPDIDVEAWLASMDRVLARAPRRIVCTHFGPFDDPEAHFAELRRGLRKWAARVRESLDVDDPDRDDPDRDERRAREFAEWLKRDLATRMPSEVAGKYTATFGYEDSWWGLARYWRTRPSPAGGASS